MPRNEQQKREAEILLRLLIRKRAFSAVGEIETLAKCNLKIHLFEGNG